MLKSNSCSQFHPPLLQHFLGGGEQHPQQSHLLGGTNENIQSEVKTLLCIGQLHLKSKETQGTDLLQDVN